MSNGDHNSNSVVGAGDESTPKPHYSIDPNDGKTKNQNNIHQHCYHALHEYNDNDDGGSPLLKRIKTNERVNSADSHNWGNRRPSFLGLGSSLNLSKENDKLLNYIEKSSRLDTVQELRHLSLIGHIGRYFDWSESYKTDDELKALKNRKLRNFYEDQNELIEKYQEVDKLLDSGIQINMIRNYSDRNDHGEVHRPINNETYGSIEHEDDDIEPPTTPLHRKDSAVPGNIDLETGLLLGYNKADEIALINFAILVNFAANIALLLGKVVVAVLTSSISIVASVIDSALDFLSTLIIYFSNKLANTKNPKRFPIGRARLEPIGVLIFSIIIIISFLQIGIESIQRLIYPPETGEVVAIGFISTAIMVVTILVKVVCYFWCKSIKSSSVAALAQDALVDVVFNTFSIIMPVLGYYFQLYWFDPLGALLLSIYIVVQWSYTCFEHIIHLTGKSADIDDQRVILYLCSRFAEKIHKIKTLNCYHVGDSLNVEVDLILDSNLSIRDSHDLAEALQYTLEALPIVNIERAFVHIDYTVTNYRGHLS